MKVKLYFLLCLSGMLIFNIMAIGQRTVVKVDPDQGISNGALNNAISKATDPGNTIFELKRGGLYLLNGTIAHSGYTLWIRAEQGTGPRPVLQPAVDINGSSARHFTGSDNIILEGLFIYGQDELGASLSQLVRESSSDKRVILKDCYFDYSSGQMVGITGLRNKIYISDCIFRNSINPTDPNNGRIIDTRSNPQDTISIENTTMYMFGSEIIRHSGAFVKYLKINHCTAYNGAIQDHRLDISTDYEAIITNNLFYNFGWRGRTDVNAPLIGMDSLYTSGIMTDAGRKINVSHNNWWLDPQIGQMISLSPLNFRFETWDTEKKDTIWYRHKMRWYWFANDSLVKLNRPKPYTDVPAILNFIKNKQVDTTALFREKLSFKNAPPIPVSYYTFFAQKNFSIVGTQPPSPYADEDPSKIGEVVTGAYDFSYYERSRSATAAEGGKPLGDPRWVPYHITSANGINSHSEDQLVIHTYPNPASTNVTFTFNRNDVSSVKIHVYDILGQEVLTVSRNLAGNNMLNLNLSELEHSGMLLYKADVKYSGGLHSSATGKIHIQ